MQFFPLGTTAVVLAIAVATSSAHGQSAIKVCKGAAPYRCPSDATWVKCGTDIPAMASNHCRGAKSNVRRLSDVSGGSCGYAVYVLSCPGSDPVPPPPPPNAPAASCFRTAPTALVKFSLVELSIRNSCGTCGLVTYEELDSGKRYTFDVVVPANDTVKLTREVNSASSQSYQIVGITICR